MDLKNIQKQFQGLELDIKWVNPENIHLTLRFLGNIASQQFDCLKETFPSIGNNLKPFYINIATLGVFPKIQYPKTLWAGITKGKNECLNMAQQIDHSLQEAR